QKNQRLRHRAQETAHLLRELQAAEWTPRNRKEHYQELTAACAQCHSAFPYSRKLPSLSFDSVAFTRVPSAESCGRCHTEVLAEWKTTLHGTAWQDPVFVA